METILIVDDEDNILTSLDRGIKQEGYQVLLAKTGQAGVAQARKEPVDLVLLDVCMPDLDGLEVLKMVKAELPYLPVIMMSGHGTIGTAVEATKLGAYNFLEKPLSLDQVLLSIRRALDYQRLEQENITLKKKVERRYQIIGTSRVMRELLLQVQQVAPTTGRVLICGENGTGKELVARAIHRYSGRREKPFVEVNCAAIPDELIESELFGHEKGAFTGAASAKTGKFELADQGTIFLDEVADMSPKTQAKVLRVLEEGELERVGGTRKVKVDVRVIAASNRNLEEEIRRGKFREDLYYRLNVIPMYVAPLRERKEDIPLLVEHFIKATCEENGKKLKQISDAAIGLLCEYDWPGNVRELKNIVERMVILVNSNRIEQRYVRSVLQVAEPKLTGDVHKHNDYRKPLKEAVSSFERNYILEKLQTHNWNVSQTAKALKIERSHLYKKMRRYNMI